MKEILFTFEIVTETKTLVRPSNLLQVGFLNYSNRDPIYINGFPLYPVDKTAIPLSDINKHLLWFPMLDNEKDVTQYKLEFRRPTADVKEVYVFYKLLKI